MPHRRKPFSLPARCTGFLHRLIRNQRGVAAIEFALIAPIMVLLSIGAAETSRAMEIHRRFGTVTSMLAHLVAREKELKDDDLIAISAIASHVMEPYDTTGLKFAIISVKAAMNDRNNTRVEWSYASGTGATKPQKCTTFTLPTNLLDPGGSTIVVQSSYDFEPMTNFLGAFQWSDELMHSPRNSCVSYNDQKCLLTCAGFN